MIKTKLIYDPVSGPGQLEAVINKTLELLQKDGTCKIVSVQLANGQALIVYDELSNSKSKKILNEKA